MTTHYDQHQVPVAYPPPSTACLPQPSQIYPPQAVGNPQGPYVPPPPPIVYPMKDGSYPQNPTPVETKSRGDDFWKGCFAAVCCCCVLDVCCF